MQNDTSGYDYWRDCIRLRLCPGDRPAYRGKLLAMGLIRGAKITVERIAPLGDPVEIQVRGFSLSLRKNENDGFKILNFSSKHYLLIYQYVFR